MKSGARFDDTRREVYSREIDPKKSTFHLSRRRQLWIALTVSPLLLLTILAYWLEQPFGLWFSAAMAAMLGGWQVLFYGFARARDERALDVTNFYPRGYLVFIFTVLAALIAFVTWRLWVQFPGHHP
jgi:hypothetical protein